MSNISLDGLPQLDVESVQALYPFHPLSVYLIGELTRRFAQTTEPSSLSLQAVKRMPLVIA